MKKKILTLLLTSVVCLTLIGCGNSNDKQSTSEKEEITSNSEEHIPLTPSEVIKLHKKMLPKFREYITSLNPNIEEKTNEKLEGDKIEGISYISCDLGTDPKEIGFINVYYYARANDDWGNIEYCTTYKIDEDNPTMPSIDDLYFKEPYKILTGKDLSQESINKIYESFDSYYNHNIGYGDYDIEEDGNFMVKLNMYDDEFCLLVFSAED